jgi:HEAT repeat protein
MVTLLSDKSPEASAGAVAGLGALDAVESAEAIVPMLRDDAPVVRAYAAQALGDFGWAASIQDIRVLLDDRNPLVRALAVQSLHRLDAVECWGDVAVAMLGDTASHIVKDSLRGEKIIVNVAMCAYNALAHWCPGFRRRDVGR